MHNVGGMEALAEVVAHANPPVVWRNPLSAYYLEDEMISVGSCLWSLVEAVRDGKPSNTGRGSADSIRRSSSRCGGRLRQAACRSKLVADLSGQVPSRRFPR